MGKDGGEGSGKITGQEAGYPWTYLNVQLLMHTTEV